MNASERNQPDRGAEEQLICARDQVPLVKGKVTLTYQGHVFPVELLRCPICGEAVVPEELVKGRLREVEETLEDK